MKRYEHTKAESKMRRAIANMPFGGGGGKLTELGRKIGFDEHRDPVPMTNEFAIERIAEYLEELGNVLSEHLNDQVNAEQELTELKRSLLLIGKTMMPKRPSGSGWEKASK